MKSVRERQIPYHLYVESIKQDTDEPVKQKQTQGYENRLWLPRGRGWREGWIGSLRLVDANYYMDNG